MAPATVCARLAAVKKLASEAEENGLLDPMIAAGISRIRGVPRLGVRVGNWLSREQAQQLLEAPDPLTFVGIRDRALLSALLGAGLRREEVANLTFEHIQTRDGRAVICDIKGKGGRIRTVPIGAWVRQAIDEWASAAGLSAGIVFRAAYTRGFDHGAARSMRDAGMSVKEIAAHFGVSASAVSYAAKKSETGARLLRDRPLSAQCIFRVVRRHAASIGVDAAPHDLRRTFAKLARKGGSPIEQIQLTLGHSSVQTTERYLCTEQDLRDSPADRLGLGEPPRARRRK